MKKFFQKLILSLFLISGFIICNTVPTYAQDDWASVTLDQWADVDISGSVNGTQLKIKANKGGTYNIIACQDITVHGHTNIKYKETWTGKYIYTKDPNGTYKKKKNGTYVKISDPSKYSGDKYKREKEHKTEVASAEKPTAAGLGFAYLPDGFTIGNTTWADIGRVSTHYKSVQTFKFGI